MSETPTTVQDLRARMDAGLARFEAALDRLSEAQITGPKDAAGWNVRDHITHLAAWADGVAALLRREDRWAAMGVPRSIPEGEHVDYDTINEQIAEQHRARSAFAARELLRDAHARLAAAVESLSDEQLAWPYDRFVAPFTGGEGRAIVEYIAGNHYDHFEEHLPWLLAIAEGR